MPIGNGWSLPTPPKQFSNQEELLNYVAETPGAIGYLDEEIVIEHVIILQIK